MQFGKNLSSQRWTKSYFAMACSNDPEGEGGQQNLKTVLNITASFSDELLARRCGISDVVFEGGCVILDIFWATADAKDPHVPQCALTH